MKKLLTTVILVTAMAIPAFAEGDDPSSPAGEPYGSVKASTDKEQHSGAPVAYRARAQAPLPRKKGSTAGSIDTYMGYDVSTLRSPTGMDGGNRK